VILLAEHDEPLLAAKKKRQPGASSWATSTPKNRVWGFENTPSGRPNAEPQLSWENATGSVQYTYQIASGRAEWLSRDPLGEGNDNTLYSYVWNDPIDWYDPFGLAGGGRGSNSTSNMPVKNGSPGNSSGSDPSQQFVASRGFRAGVGAGEMVKGGVAMFEGAGLCTTGPGALAGVPLMLGGIWGLFDGADNMKMAGAPAVNGGGGLPIFQTPPPSAPAPSGGHK
jgi:hypothetical protein